MSMALVMSQMPDVWRKVLAEHVPDQSQRCRECRDQAGQVASWPCQTYRVAQEAKWVAEGNLPGTGPHGPGPSASPYMSPPSGGFGSPTPARGPSTGAYASLSEPSYSSFGDPSLGRAGGYGSDSSGTPGPGSFASGSFASPSYGSPDPGYGSSYGGSSYGGSVYDAPLAGDPLGAPSWREPSRPEPSYPEPSYPEPSHSEPSWRTPSWETAPGEGGPRHGDPYGSRVDAPYGASFGVDDRPSGPVWR